VLVCYPVAEPLEPVRVRNSPHGLRRESAKAQLEPGCTMMTLTLEPEQ